MPDNIPTAFVLPVLGVLGAVIVQLFRITISGYERQLTSMREQLDRANANADHSADLLTEYVQTGRRTVRMIEEQNK